MTIPRILAPLRELVERILVLLIRIAADRCRRVRWTVSPEHLPQAAALRDALDAKRSRQRTFSARRGILCELSVERIPVSSDGRSFRRGKGERPDHLLCIVCGRKGHKSGNYTHTQTIKGDPAICMWLDGKVVLKSSMSVVCISFNLSGCPSPKHNTDILHICSLCGSKSHSAASKLC
jgi:hypothetical protein